jgi:hypothetical protein
LGGESPPNVSAIAAEFDCPSDQVEVGTAAA